MVFHVCLIESVIVWTSLSFVCASSLTNDDHMPQEVHALIGEAVRIADNADEEFERVWFRTIIADRIFDSYPDTARQLLLKAKKTGKASKDPWILHATTVLTSPGLVKSGDRRDVNGYVAAIESVSGAGANKYSQIVLGIGVFSLSDWDSDRAVQLVQNIEQDDVRYHLLGVVASTVAKNDKAKAIEILHSIPEEISLGYRLIMKIDGIESLDEKKQLSLCQEILKEIDKAKTILDQQFIYSLYVSIALNSNFRKADPSKAESLLNESIRILRSLNDPGGRLSGIAKEVSTKWDRGKGINLFREAVELAEKEGATDPYQAACALLEIARNIRSIDKAKGEEFLKDAEKRFRHVVVSLSSVYRVQFLSSMATFYFSDSK